MKRIRTAPYRGGCALPFLLLFYFTSFANASFFSSGEDAGSIDDYLRSGIGARHLAMGRTGVASPSGSDAVYWNPAGLNRLSAYEAVFMYNKLFAGTNEYFTGAVFPTQWLGNFGVGALQLKVEDVAGWDNQNFSTGGLNNEKSTYFVSYGNSGYDSALELGATLKISYHNVAGYSDTGFGFDAGAIYTFGGLPVSVGAVCRNILGPSIKLKNERERFPSAVTIGAAVEWMNFLSALDAGWTSSQKAKVSFGTEYLRFKPFALRFGINETEITYGFGFRRGRMALNYAFAEHVAWEENLGSSHRVDICWMFSDVVQKFKGGGNKKARKLFRRARKFYRKGQYFFAVDALKETRSYDSQDTEAAELLREISVRLEDAASSGKIKTFEDAAYTRGVLFYLKNDYPSALNQLKQVESLDPSRKEVREIIKKLEEDILREKREKEEREKAALLERLLNDGIYLYSVEEFENAVKKFEEILKIDPENQEAEKYLSLCMEELERLKEPLKPKPKPRLKKEKKAEEKKEIIALDPAKAEALYNDGLVEYSLGRLKNAVNYWNMALKYDPGSRKIKKAIKNAERKLK